ncbi:hypothetical protein J0A67_13190 [Algoriphagus aestuariicola]|uniref:Uncharacterized protein n=1 Tax=Algoriphagus aestuariicola TaxID=1852016 RepID=A0ABS3BRB1_9BACT|nr:hypothetical protein [Algoriphagus aestuariicola]MBN7801822.1 hypothetical protein [Algoriphagus aestuariicola]
MAGAKSPLVRSWAKIGNEAGTASFQWAVFRQAMFSRSLPVGSLSSQLAESTQGLAADY